MKKYIMLFMVLSLMSVPCVMAGTGSLDISPRWVTMVDSPADFTISCKSGSSYDVNILLVMTDLCHDSLQGPDPVVIVDLEGGGQITFNEGDFESVVGVPEPPPDVPDSSVATSGAQYNHANLRSHLSYGLSEPLEKTDILWWDMKPLGINLEDESKSITITLNSNNPRMLVYLLGKSESTADLFDMRIPPTNPGFIVPEVAIGSVMAVASMFTALGLYLYKKKHTATK